MSTPPPFSEDFLQTIVNVSWPSFWLACEMQTQSIGAGTIALSFPNFAGGTPGYLMYDGSTINGRFAALPLNTDSSDIGYVIKDTDVIQQFTTEAGAPFIGFGAGNIYTADDVVSVIVLLRLSSLQAVQAFKVRYSVTGADEYRPRAIVRLLKKIPPTTTQLSNQEGFASSIAIETLQGNELPVAARAQALGDFGSGTVTMDFTVDPIAHTVVFDGF